MRRKEHILIEDYAELPKGSHITVVEAYHVNRDTKRQLLEETRVTIEEIESGKSRFCYTAKGFLIVPSRIIQEK